MTNKESDFNYLSADQAYNTIYLQFPLVFLNNPYYRNMSDTAKIGYIVLKNRSEYSLENNLVDEKNRVYFIYTDQEFADMLNKSRPTAIKVKKELSNYNLLKKVDMGYNKIKKQRNPSRHYLAELNVSASDVYPLVNKKHGKTSLPWSKPKNNTANINKSHSKESLHSEMLHGKESLQYIYKQYKDNKEFKDRNTDENQIFSNSFESMNENKELEKELIDTYIELNSLDLIYGERLITAIKSYSFGSYETFKLYTDKIIYALNSAEKELGYSINFIENNYLKKMLYRTFKVSIIKEKNGEIKSFTDYLFISFKNCFLDFAKNKDNQFILKEKKEEKEIEKKYKSETKKALANGNLQEQLKIDTH